MNSPLPYSSQSVFLPLSPPKSYPSTLYSFLHSFYLLFLLSFSRSSLTLFSLPSPITVKLQGGWLGTFLTEKFGFDQNHLWAFLHSFPNLNDFAASQAHPPRQSDILKFVTLQVSCPPLSFAHAYVFTSLLLCLSHMHKYTYTKHNLHLQVV